MSNPVSKFMIPSAAYAPRGAHWVAALVNRTMNASRAFAAQAATVARHAGRAVWRELETIGEARSQRELRLLARPWNSPDRAGQAAAVRQFAYGHIESDPRFATELFAAADRHEQDETPAHPQPPHTAQAAG